MRQMQRIIRDYYEQLYANKMDTLEEMGKFLERDNLQDWRGKENGKYEQTYHKYWNWKWFKSSNKQKSKTRCLHRWILTNA